MIRLAAFGDSLTAGYGLPAYSSFPAYLERYLLEEGHPVEVLNFGISGETSAEGLFRLAEVIDSKPDAAYIEFGANDCFQLVDPEETAGNLAEMIKTFQKNNIKVLLLGYKPLDFIPKSYSTKFCSIFEKLANKYKIHFTPNLMQGLYADPNYLLADGVHPSQEGVRAMTANLYPLFDKFLSQIEQK